MARRKPLTRHERAELLAELVLGATLAAAQVIEADSSKDGLFDRLADRIWVSVLGQLGHEDDEWRISMSAPA